MDDNPFRIGARFRFDAPQHSSGGWVDGEEWEIVEIIESRSWTDDHGGGYIPPRIRIRQDQSDSIAHEMEIEYNVEGRYIVDGYDSNGEPIMEKITFSINFDEMDKLITQLPDHLQADYAKALIEAKNEQEAAAIRVKIKRYVRNEHKRVMLESTTNKLLEKMKQHTI